MERTDAKTQCTELIRQLITSVRAMSASQLSAFLASNRVGVTENGYYVCGKRALLVVIAAPDRVTAIAALLAVKKKFPRLAVYAPTNTKESYVPVARYKSALIIKLCECGGICASGGTLTAGRVELTVSDCRHAMRQMREIMLKLNSFNTSNFTFTAEEEETAFKLGVSYFDDVHLERFTMELARLTAPLFVRITVTRAYAPLTQDAEMLGRAYSNLTIDSPLTPAFSPVPYGEAMQDKPILTAAVDLSVTGAIDSLIHAVTED